MNNDSWAHAIIECLVQLGITDFALAPGSRCTPLTLAIARHPKTRAKVHYDERALGFYTLGYGKAKHIPCPIITTSGSAAGNLLPAIMEAHHAHIPMLIITADRPPELLECAANQTTRQQNIFGEFVRWQCTLPCPAPELSEHYLASTLSYAMQQALCLPRGPVHINCMFREPLFCTPASATSSIKAPFHSIPQWQASAEDIEKCILALNSYEKGIIVAGNHSRESCDAILQCAERLRWPIWADILSPLRSLGRRKEILPYHEALLENSSIEKPECIVRIGDRFVSKAFSLWMADCKAACWQIAEHSVRSDPEHCVTARITANVESFLSQCLEKLPQREHNAWALSLRRQAEHISCAYEEFFRTAEILSEQSAVFSLLQSLPSKWALFLSNSLPVRHAQRFYYPVSLAPRAFVNRGLSGIDGNLATAVGIAEGMGKPLLAILGDQALLHDANSLMLLKKAAVPVIAFVINNDGGAIFSVMPISSQKDVIEEYFIEPHGLSLSPLAESLGVAAISVRTLEEMQQAMQTLYAHPRNCLVEILCSRQNTVTVHQQLAIHIKTCLKDLSSQENTQRTLCSLTL